MIRSIEIENFKSIVKLNLPLGNVNVLIGENGCGKTNILEAIGVGAASLSGRYGEEFLVPRGIRVTDYKFMKSAFDTKQAKETTELAFYDEHKEGFKISLLDDKNAIVDFLSESMSEEHKQKISKTLEALHIYKKRNKNGGEDLSYLINQINKDIKQETNNQGMLLERHISSFLCYAPENYFLRRFEEEGQVRPIGIRGEGLFKHLTELHKQSPEVFQAIIEHLYLIDWFEGLEIPQDLAFTEKRLNIQDRYIGTLEYIDQRSTNEGFLYLLFYFTILISPQTPTFFAIDNIDNALNPKLGKELIKQMTKLAVKHNKQIVLTTHNPAVLDGLDLTDERQKLFTVYRNMEGHTLISQKKANPKLQNMRLSEAFIRGYLGGLPLNF